MDEERKMFWEKCDYILLSKKWDLIPYLFDPVGQNSALNAINSFLCFAMSPDDLYHTLVKTYVMCSFDFSVEDVLKMRDLRPDNYLSELPKKYKGKDSLTVWRASVTPPEQIEQLTDEFSWTFRKETALFFAFTWQVTTDMTWRYIYRANINPKDIIAFANDTVEGLRTEELIQYKGVTDVEYVPLSIEEWVNVGEREAARCERIARDLKIEQTLYHVQKISDRIAQRRTNYNVTKQ